MTILAVCGMVREANILAAGEVRTVIGRALEYTDFSDVQGIISMGVAGGLAAERRTGDCVIATAVIANDERFATDPDWTDALLNHIPGAIAGTVLGCDAPVGDVTVKAKRQRETGAEAVDMESHLAARAARARNLPFAALRIVLDPADHTLPPAALAALTPSGTVDGLALMGSLITRPVQIPALITTARDARAALRSLFRCRRCLGERLAAPDFGKLALDMG